MSASATLATSQDGPAPPGTDTQGSGQVLHYIINVGADLIRLLHEQALAQAAQQATAFAQQAASAQHTAAPASHVPASHAPASHTTDAPPAPVPVPAPPPAPDALIKTAASFDQIARAIRRSIALAQSLDAPKQQQPARPPVQQTPDRTTARKRIIRAVEDVIQRPPDNDECDDAEVLLSDFRERMDAPELDDDVRNRPAEDIIKEILRDLGLAALPGSRPWKRRTQADIAALNARAAAPTSPHQPAPGQPSAEPQDPRPQGPRSAAAQPAPAPPPDKPEPGDPAATSQSQSGLIPAGTVHPGDTLPEDPAKAVAFILHHHARTNAQWRPPPED
ncbi:MAG: hypothetical protein ACRYHQ_40455 [Janthinobacterium lividum]